MMWILDLLIDKFRKEKEEDFQPEPLHIDLEDNYPSDDPDEDEEEKRVIIIDI